MDSLVEETKIICKEYNSKIYLASQKNFPKIDENEMKKLDDATDKTIQKLNEQKENIGSLNFGITSFYLNFIIFFFLKNFVFLILNLLE